MMTLGGVEVPVANAAISHRVAGIWRTASRSARPSW